MKRYRGRLMFSVWLLCFVVFSTSVFNASPAQSATWQSGPALGTARSQFAGSVIDDKIYVFGGNGNPDGVNLKSTEMFDPEIGSWEYQADNEHNDGFGVEEVSGATMNGKFYVFMGILILSKNTIPRLMTWSRKNGQDVKPLSVFSVDASLQILGG